jgi:signal transduction histidine kinase/CheY-like chemotaxis protein
MHPSEPFSPPRPRHPVARKLALLVSLTVTVLLAVLLIGSWFYWRAVLHRQVEDRLNAVAASRQDMVRAQVAMLLQRVQLNTDRGEMRSLLFRLENHLPPGDGLPGTEESLKLITDGTPIVAAALADKQGTIVASTNPDEVGSSLGREPSFQASLVAPFLGLPNWRFGRFEARLGAPVRNRSKPSRTYGTLLLTANVSQLADAVRDTTGLGQSGEVLLAMRDGEQLRFLFPPRNAPETTTVPATAAPALNAAAGGAEVLTRNPDYRGVPVLAAGRPIGYGGWALVVKVDESEAYAPVSRALRLGALFGILITAAGLAGSYALAHSFTKPLRRLSEAVTRLASGQEHAPVPVDSADELGALSASFNVMSADLETRRVERDRAEQALREADRRKDEFLATLGHELRNPLSAIAHAVRLWNESPQDRVATEMARSVIERQTANLCRHVDDLLDVARISEGKIELRKRPADLAEAIQRAIETTRPLLDAKEQRLEWSPGPKELWHLDADATRIEQVVANLLTNAAKFTPAGGCIRVAERYGDGEAILTVRDNGVGIRPEMLPAIFDLFAQAEPALHRAGGGLGIGLHLCRQIVELHGGCIAARSEGAGMGAEFTVRLPAKNGPAPVEVTRPVATGEVRAASRRILLADDNADAVRLLSQLLTRRGYEVSTASDGVEALRLAHEFRPDVLLLDIGLPGMDGYALARQLRANGFSATPMIAMSGYAQEADRAQAYAAGFNHHFAKPVDFDALTALLAAADTRR